MGIHCVQYENKLRFLQSPDDPEIIRITRTVLHDKLLPFQGL